MVDTGNVRLYGAGFGKGDSNMRLWLSAQSAKVAAKEVGQCDKVANRRTVRSSAILAYVNRYQLWHNVDE